MSKRIIIATLLALAVGSTPCSRRTKAGRSKRRGNDAAIRSTEPATALYRGQPAITSCEQLNP